MRSLVNRPHEAKVEAQGLRVPTAIPGGLGMGTCLLCRVERKNGAGARFSHGPEPGHSVSHQAVRRAEAVGLHPWRPCRVHSVPRRVPPLHEMASPLLESFRTKFCSACSRSPLSPCVLRSVAGSTPHRAQGFTRSAHSRDKTVPGLRLQVSRAPVAGMGDAGGFTHHGLVLILVP